MKAFISETKTALLNVTSVAGIIFMVLLGAFLDAGAPTLTQGHNAPSNPHFVASSCYTAAAIYAGLLVFGLSQSYLHKRNPSTQHF
ncbi:hypothetical protein H9P43_001082 [Blastocladiella emersonii ATCC 22665]|nr:hypothetical protein H9P43_001082 [Blastocladiella emersonii ATCC 22665]